MSKYPLKIDFSKGEDLDLIYKATEKVILVKNAEGSADSQVANASTSEDQNDAQNNTRHDSKPYGNV